MRNRCLAWAASRWSWPPCSRWPSCRRSCRGPAIPQSGWRCGPCRRRPADFPGRPRRRCPRPWTGAQAARRGGGGRGHDGLGIVDRTRHASRQDLDARMAGLSGDGGVAGRRHQRLQPDRRYRRTGAWHCGARRRGVRRHPDRARPYGGSDAAGRLRGRACSDSWSTTSSRRRSSSATAAASSPVSCSPRRPLPDGRRARPRSPRRCRC